MQRIILLVFVLSLGLVFVPVGAQTATGTGESQLALDSEYAIFLPQLDSLDLGAGERSAAQWETIEWQLPNASYAGNPYDLIARATFTHRESGETRTTGMFYVGDDTWAFRFTGTQPGLWDVQTASADGDLDGIAGTVQVSPREDNGFLVTEGRDWVFNGSGKAFLPQYVMAPAVHRLDAATIDQVIDTFIVEHGFGGFHLSMQCRWFKISESSCANITTPNPDPETFERLELLIRKTHAAGGVVHLWMWGDSQRNQNPSRWGLNGKVDQRMQRYVAARLGPLPGWTMGYGYDLFEWVNGSQLDTWHRFMQAEMGWPHPLGARGATNELSQISENLDFTSYEYWVPGFDTYRQMVAARPNKPVFAEDRYRIYPPNSSQAHKSYSEATTRRGMWHAAMAGGVANIWGNVSDGREYSFGSLPYTNAAELKTNARFFAERFEPGLIDCSQLSSAACLGRADGSRYLLYSEDSTSVTMDLSTAASQLRAVAVDTRKPYAEIDLGFLSAGRHTWEAPYASDWAIAVGEP